MIASSKSRIQCLDTLGARQVVEAAATEASDPTNRGRCLKKWPSYRWCTHLMVIYGDFLWLQAGKLPECNLKMDEHRAWRVPKRRCCVARCFFRPGWWFGWFSGLVTHDNRDLDLNQQKWWIYKKETEEDGDLTRDEYIVKQELFYGFKFCVFFSVHD